jgi:hypothetical protein
VRSLLFSKTPLSPLGRAKGGTGDVLVHLHSNCYTAHGKRRQRDPATLCRFYNQVCANHDYGVLMHPDTKSARTAISRPRLPVATHATSWAGSK